MICLGAKCRKLSHERCTKICCFYKHACVSVPDFSVHGTLIQLPPSKGKNYRHTQDILGHRFLICRQKCPASVFVEVYNWEELNSFFLCFCLSHISLEIENVALSCTRCFYTRYFVYIAAVGCPDIQAKGDAFFDRTGHSAATYGCHSTGEKWRLNCVKNKWEGTRGTCSAGTPKTKNKNNSGFVKEKNN